MDRNKLVVVLGMHRSGTSAITRGLKVIGVDLGDNLQPPAADNPRGFWEDRDILGINEELLALLGAGSQRLGLIDWKMPEAATIASLKNKAEKVLREKSDRNSPWGFKDPRTARLLPFWQSAFAAIGCDVCYVIVTRNPISIVKSLSERNGLEPLDTFYLWLEHLMPAILRTMNSKRVVIDFDQLLENPEFQLARLAHVLGLPAPDPLALAEYEQEFLDKGLRHTRYTMRDLQTYPSLPSQVMPVYAWVAKLANDEGALNNSEINKELEALTRQLMENTPAYWRATLADQMSAIRVRERIIAERDDTIGAQARLIDDGVAGMAAMEKMIQERDEIIRVQTSLIDDRVAGMSTLEEAIRHRDKTISERESEIARLRGNLFVRVLIKMKLIH